MLLPRPPFEPIDRLFLLLARMLGDFDGIEQAALATAGTARELFAVGVALLGPRIAAIVITAHLPVSRRVPGYEFNRLQPFRTLPEIEMRHHQADRAAVLGLERLAGPAVYQQRIFGGKILQRQVGGVAVV